MSSEKISQIQEDLKNVDRRGGLTALSAVAGIPVGRLVQLMKGEGESPNILEIAMIDALRSA